MRPLNQEQIDDRDAQIAEYRRLISVAEDALSGIPIRGRPNWHLFFEAQEHLAAAVRRIREINDGTK